MQYTTKDFLWLPLESWYTIKTNVSERMLATMTTLQTTQLYFTKQNWWRNIKQNDVITSIIDLTDYQQMDWILLELTNYCWQI